MCSLLCTRCSQYIAYISQTSFPHMEDDLFIIFENFWKTAGFGFDYITPEIFTGFVII